MRGQQLPTSACLTQRCMSGARSKGVLLMSTSQAPPKSVHRSL